MLSFSSGRSKDKTQRAKAVAPKLRSNIGRLAVAFASLAGSLFFIMPLPPVKKPSSFPRKRESILRRVCADIKTMIPMRMFADSYARYRERWIPAFAGMTDFIELLKIDGWQA
jgi:hypothetical protein